MSDDDRIEIKHSTEDIDVTLQVAPLGDPLPDHPRAKTLQAMAQHAYPGSVVFLFTERAVVYMPLPGDEDQDTVRVQPVLTVCHPRSHEILEAALQTMVACKCGHPQLDHLFGADGCYALDSSGGLSCPCKGYVAVRGLHAVR